MRAACMLLIALGLVLWTPAVQAERIEVAASTDEAGLRVAASGAQGASLVYRMSAFEMSPMALDGRTMQTITLPGVLLPNDAGAPNLPGMSGFLALPQGATASIEITRAERRVYTDIDVAPAPVIPRENEDGPLTYAMNPRIYERNALYPESPVTLSEPRKLRGVDVVAVGVTPFQYNPVTRELVVYTELEVRVDFAGGNGQFGEERLRSRYWEPILRGHLMNYAMLPRLDFDRPGRDNRYGWEYVIICPDHPDFIAWADTLKSWRTEQGIHTEVFTTTDIGATTARDIEIWLDDAYWGWEMPPVAFLILGDYPNSGDRTEGVLSPIWNSYCVSDNIYADADGDDLPDMAHGRICARDAAELETMIGKMLSYEREPYTDEGFYDHPIIAGGWQTERWFVLCTEVCYGHQEVVLGKHPVREYAIYSGAPGDVWSTATNTDVVVDYFGPNGLGYIPATPEHLTDWGGNASRINADINAGAYMLLHRDHGNTSGWGEPSYNIGSLGGLTNDMYPFVFSINCLTGKYNSATPTFTEVFHRMEHGALGLVAASEVSYSFVNDTFVWGMFDGMWPEFMPDYSGYTLPAPGAMNLRTAFGMAYGKYFLAGSGWPYNQGSKDVTYHLFHHHGDAFMSIHSEMPEELSVWHYGSLPLGSDAFAVQANEGALIALTVDGEIIGVAEATGAPQVIEVAPQMAPGEAKLVVTKANAYRHEEMIPIAGTLYAVEADGSGDYPTIQAAIDAATSGTIIELGDGTYTGAGNHDLDTGGKAVTIRSRGADPELCVIDCQGSASEARRAFHFHSGEGPDTRIEALTITGGYTSAASGSGIYCSASSPTLVNLRFIENAMASSGGGLACSDGAAPTVSGCRFENNDADMGAAVHCGSGSSVLLTECVLVNNGTGGYTVLGGGVHVTDGAADIEHCTFAGNRADDGAAIAVGSSGTVLCENTILAFHAVGEAVHCQTGGSATLTCCDVYGNEGGDWVGCIAGQYGADGNIAEDPLFCDAAEADYTLHSLSPCAPESDPTCGLLGALPVGCWPEVMVVRPDGTGDYATIADAVAAAGFGDAIELTDGVFTGEGNRDITLDVAGLAIRSRTGIATNCIIDAQAGPGDEHAIFHIPETVDALSVIENLTLRGAYAAGASGGAIRCLGSPTLQGVIFEDCLARSGGALHITGSPGLYACTFAHCEADSGAAIYVGDDGAPTLMSCTFVSNQGPAADPTGALECAGASTVTVENTIIAFGVATSAVTCTGGSAQLSCCDLYGNEAGDWVGCIADQFGTDGNIAEDPIFCDYLFGNYELTDTSPCAPEHNPACGLVGAWPVGCNEAPIIYPDGSGFYATIQAAINDVTDGMTIRLANGVFTGPGNRDLDFGGKNLMLASVSGCPDSCIIDSEGSAEEMHRVIRFHSDETSESVVQGITLRGGYHTYGGAVHIQGAAPLFRNCIFEGNTGEYHGGGIYVYFHSGVEVENCTFVDNTAIFGAGISCHSYSTADVSGTIIAFNHTGDAIHCYFNSETILSCCDLFGNEGGDYVSCAEGFLGVDGNISADPEFCDAAAGNYWLWSTSPCAPDNSPACCELIGALGVGCDDTSGAPEHGRGAPRALRLSLGTPTTAARGATIRYALPGTAATPIRLQLYDASGRLVRTLVDGPQTPGFHELTWDGRGAGGAQAGSGVYFCRLTADGRTLTRNLVLVR